MIYGWMDRQTGIYCQQEVIRTDQGWNRWMNRRIDRRTDEHLLPRNRKKIWMQGRINKQTITANRRIKGQINRWNMDRQMIEQTDEWTDRWINRLMNEQTHKCTDRWISRQMNEQTDEWTDRWMNRQMNEQTHGQKDEWTDRWMNKQMCRWIAWQFDM